MAYIKYKGSPDVFDETTGRYISAVEAQKIPNFQTQVKELNVIRPDITNEADFAKLSGTNVAMSPLPSPTPPQNPPQDGGTGTPNPAGETPTTQQNAPQNPPNPQGATGGQNQAQNASQGQIDASRAISGQSPVQVGGKFGTQQFGRLGNDVYEIMSDGSRRKVTEAEFSQKLKAQGLNLEVLPQLDLKDNIADNPAGPPNPAVNTDGTPKGPIGFLEDYKSIIKDLGLTDIKSQFEATKKEYQNLQDQKNAEILAINDNPWVSEGLRQKQVEKVNSRYELKENTLSNQQKLYESMYEEGIAQAKFLASGVQEDRNKLLDIAQKKEEALAKLNTVDTQVVEANGRKLLINSKTGKTIADIGKADGGGNETKRTNPELQVFSNTQINKGAAMAEVDDNTFRTYDYETANYYINNGGNIDKAKKQIKQEFSDGTSTIADVVSELDKQNIPKRVKDQLTLFAQQNAPVPKEPIWFNPLTWF